MAVTFVNFKETVTTQNSFNRLKIRRVSFALNWAYFVFNLSCTNPAVVKLMVSSNQTLWMEDGVILDVGPGELIYLVPNYFSKYATLEYKSKNPCHPAKLTTWFQMTRPPAKKCFGVGNDWS